MCLRETELIEIGEGTHLNRSTMRVLVSGYRHFQDYQLFSGVCRQLNITELIHGDCSGADTLAQRYAEEHKIPVRRFPVTQAQWRESKRHGPERNQRMIDEARPELAIVFLSSKSKGTKDMLTRLEKAQIPTMVWNI